jgi:hypothetical protein
MNRMVANNEAATRHFPVARVRARKNDVKTDAARERKDELQRASETRMQAAVVVSHKRDDVDPYADVPCTD